MHVGQGLESQNIHPCSRYNARFHRFFFCPGSSLDLQDFYCSRIKHFQITLDATHPDCSVCAHGYQLSLVQSELLYRPCVTGASVFPSDLDLYQTSVPQ